MGKVIFNESAAPVACAVKEFSRNGAVLSMTGWLGVPSTFTLYVEPDSVRADCRIINRKGSKVQVEFIDLEDDVRYRQAS